MFAVRLSHKFNVEVFRGSYFAARSFLISKASMKARELGTTVSLKGDSWSLFHDGIEKGMVIVRVEE